MGHRLWMTTTMMLAMFNTFFLLSDAAKIVSFDENYDVTWGNDHVLFLNEGREVQLTLDQASGAGFASKAFFGSGYFQMRIKLPPGDSGGLVTAFYVPTNALNLFVKLFLNSTVHDELDFEFLGNRPGRPTILQTNVFINNVGGREQKIHLWFDPTVDFHDYQLLWNNHQILFFVDDIPIRVHKNNINKAVVYPSRTMQVMVSLWDGSHWATDGGRTKANYSNAPFQAHFQDFNIDGCVWEPTNPNIDCYSENYWWNTRNYWELNPQQLKVYEHVRKNHMIYDFCTDRTKNPIGPPLECIG